MKPVRVIVVDDNFFVRAGLRALLNQGRDIEIVAEASGGREALQLLENATPDVMLLDISMPEMDGLDVAARVADEFPSVRVIMLSAYVDAARIRRAMLAGVAGYVAKDDTDEVVSAVKAVAAGGTHFSAQVTQRIATDRSRESYGVPLTGVLPTRQNEILKLVAHGLAVKEIAVRLNIPARVAEAHIARLMERLGVRDIDGLVYQASRLGLTPPDK